MTDTKSEADRGRLLWPDLAKSACIILVVVWHVVSKSLIDLQPGAAYNFWNTVCLVLQPVRIPLFFTISGYFVATKLQQPWSQCWRRPAGNYWTYVVWTAIQAVVFGIFPLPTSIISSPRDAALALVLGYTAVWYLFALALYFIGAKLFNRARLAALILALGFSIVSYVDVLPDIGNSDSIIRNAFFFLVGAYAPRQRAAAVMSGGRWVPAILLWAAFLPASILAVITRFVGNPAIGLPLSALGVAAGLMLASSIAATPGAIWLARVVGERTVSIYVLHLPLLAVAMAAISTIPELIAWGYPVVASAALVAVSVVVHPYIQRWAPWLFALPTRNSSRPDSSSGR